MFRLHVFRELVFESLKVSPSIIVLGDFEIFYCNLPLAS